MCYTYWLRVLRGVTLVSVLAAAAVSGQPVSKSVDFNREVRPILSDNCFTCHGPDEKKRMVNLRLDNKEGAFADRGGYTVIVPGDSAKSRLYQRISAQNQAMRMPAGGGPGLNDKQIALIKRWIDEGAKWETHWAYAPPRRWPVPEVANRKWARNPIDQFVLARLEREGLKPSAETDRVTLARRVTLDLTGLPSTPAEVDEFLADRSPDAYEKLVDRLLASPRYGERMAMQWLDLARYADTHGYHIDSHRDMWAWRDWVIDAFNRNMPFDRFTVEQLAGDLLPGATREQRIATGFNRNHMINYEGGAIPEEYLNEYVVDRVEATATTWMGMTMGCARCHDHKYDPIKQRDFYRFYAFFNNVAEEGLDGRAGNAEPVLQLPNPEQMVQLDDLKRKIIAAEEELLDDLLAGAPAEWEKAKLATMTAPSREGLVAHYELDGHFSDTSGRYQHGRAIRGEVTFGDGPAGRAGVLSGETHVSLGEAGALERNEPFSLALWIRPGSIREMPLLQRLDPETRRGWELVLEESVAIGDLKRGAHLRFSMVHRAPDDALVIRTKERLVLGPFIHVVLTYDGRYRLYIDGEPRQLEVVSDSLSGSIRAAAPLEIGNKKLGLPYKGSLDDVRIYSRAITAAEVDQLAFHEPVRATLLETGKRSRDQKVRLREYYLVHDAPEPKRKLYADLKALYRRQKALDKVVPTTMVMEEQEVPRETHVLGRGDYRNLGEKVTPAVPTVLPPLAKDAPANRLGLARWLVDPSHPLTARVAVNRLWQMCFGLGLVKTAEDFGSQGEPPSHLELLDWLATEFVRSGWDLKAMERLIVTSATYRQASKVTRELLEKDPENRLLARGPRFRMPAEMVRDNALAAAGLLNRQIGGPSVYPYQPPGLWEEVAYGDVFSAQTYSPGHGRDLYRRSMYTFWKRTSPPPSLVTFDAPDREKCVARRARTNTPLQALVLMNDPTYVEAARALAQRMLLEAGRDPGARVTLGYRLAVARKPLGKEVAVLRDLARRQLAEYRRDPTAAERLLGVGESKPDARLDRIELAAWTTVASAILNLDETITKE